MYQRILKSTGKFLIYLILSVVAFFVYSQIGLLILEHRWRKPVVMTKLEYFPELVVTWEDDPAKFQAAVAYNNDLEGYLAQHKHHSFNIAPDQLTTINHQIKDIDEKNQLLLRYAKVESISFDIDGENIKIHTNNGGDYEHYVWYRVQNGVIIPESQTLIGPFGWILIGSIVFPLVGLTIAGF